MCAIHLFPDTNTFLHFRSAEEIDLPKSFGKDSVVLVIAPVVIRELNDQKDRNSVARLRKRAGSALQRLHRYLLQAAPAALRNNVTLIFQTTEPIDIDFAVNRLSLQSNDDQLIGSLLQFKKENPDLEVALLTNDVGLMAKAAGRSIAYFGLSEDCRLPDEPDPLELKAKQLEEQLRKLQATLPDMTLRFQGGESHHRVKLKPQVNFTTERRNALLEQEKAKHPKATEHLEIPELGISARKWKSHEQVRKDNEELEKYYSDFEEYLAADNAYTNRSRLQFLVELEVENSGGIPADDVDISLRFPPGVHLTVRTDALPKRPSRPKPPLSVFDKQMRSLMAPTFGMDYAREAAYLSAVVPNHTKNVSDLWIVASDIRGHIKKVKHGMSIILPSILAEFESPEQVRSFSIEAIMLVANHPEQLKSTLNIVVEIEPQPTEEESSSQGDSFEL
jgi:hypothetical protein